MRYLNKVVFINSASIAYGEVMIDGNVHFIGTQGVGKSTLLRSILFFYNADTLRLGISREKKSFAEYYLPYANSYIIYEVVKETGPYTIMAFKSQGKVCYRFLDTPFNKDIFIQEDGTVLDTWDKIRAGLDKQKVDYSRKIDRYEEYRDILYGNNEGKKEMRKYAFLESRQYQNIPRTIQNVFLNSKLEAEFIKETIIHSLNDDDIVIKLDTYQYQLKDFEEQLKDIRQFRQPAVQKQSAQVADLYLAIRRHEREKRELSQQLEHAFDQATQQQTKTAKELEKEHERKKAIQARQDDVKKRYDNKKDKLVAEISVLDDKLKTVKDKKAYYDRINITNIAERVQQKTVVEKQAANLDNEKALLSAQYRETTQKYNALLQELANQWAANTNIYRQQQLAIETSLLQKKEAVARQYALLINTAAKQHQQKLAGAVQATDEALARLTQAEVKRAEARHRNLYAEEIQMVQAELQQYQAQHTATRLQIEALRGLLATIQKQWDLEEEARADKQNSHREKLDAQLANLQLQADAIATRLQNTKGSLYEWLNNNKPGWHQTIGKVCNEAVLFMSDLSPVETAEATSLYGVNINLKEIESIAKTADEYQAEKAILEKNMEKLLGDWVMWKEKWDEETGRLHKKIAVQLRETREEIKEQEYNLQQQQQRTANATLQLNDWMAKATEDKAAALAEADQAVERVAAEKHAARDQVKKIEDEIEKQVKAKYKERDAKIAEATTESADAIAQVEATMQQGREEHETRLAEIKQKQQQELHDSGADVARLNEIEQQLGILHSELKFIEKNRDTVAEYKKDKRELLDKAEDIKNSRLALHQQLLTEESKYNTQQRALHSEEETINETLQQLHLLQQQLGEDIAEYNDMQLIDWYEKPALDKRADNLPTGRRCKDLARLIKELHYATIEKVNDVKEVINKFLSHFSSNNIFKFSAMLIDKKEYLDFAEKLQQFIEDNRIAEFEKRVNERYASIIKLIGKETNELTSSEGQIQKIISRINNDFTQNNAIAVGVIQKIEMKMDESGNKVVQVLKLIQQFNSESGFELGAANLFTQHDSDSKNKKAVDLLKQLIKEIHNLRRDTISLSDSFEIKFRIIENKNDTGWVERLANVGSEGTDVLVKAMINIMLLNVFKEGASKRFKDFKLHCMMDEIGRLHPVNVRGILNFASARNIWLINGSPTENDALAYRHIYKLEKDSSSVTRVKRILSQHNV